MPRRQRLRRGRERDTPVPSFGFYPSITCRKTNLASLSSRRVALRDERQPSSAHRQKEARTQLAPGPRHHVGSLHESRAEGQGHAHLIYIAARTRAAARPLWRPRRARCQSRPWDDTDAQTPSRTPCGQRGTGRCSRALGKRLLENPRARGMTPPRLTIAIRFAVFPSARRLATTPSAQRVGTPTL